MAADQQHRTYDPLKRVSDTGCKRTVLGYVSGSDPAGSDFGGRGAVLESDLAVCTQFLGSGRGRRTE